MIIEEGEHIIRIRNGQVYIDGILEQDYCEESDTLEHKFEDGRCSVCDVKEAFDVEE